MQFLVIVVLVSLTLLAIYILARYVRIAGQALAFVCQAVSRIAIRISEFLSLGGDYAHQALLSSLNYPSSNTTLWGGLKVLSRLVFFLMAVCVLGGEAGNTLIAIPALFNTPLNVSLPGGVELASAMLFLGCPALLGAVFLEFVGLIPHDMGLFGDMKIWVRRTLGFVTALLLLLSMLVLFLFWEFRPMFLADPDSTQVLRYIILGGLGVTVAGVSVFAMLALTIGAAGVIATVLWVVEQVCRIIAAASSVVTSCLDLIAIHLSQGTMSVQGEFIGHESYQVPPLFLPASSSQESGVHLSGGASLVDADVNVAEARSVENSLEEKMSNPDKNASLSFIGSDGSRMFVPIKNKIADIGAGGSILTSSSLDLTSVHKHYSIAGVCDLSPSYGLIKKALLQGGSESRVYAAIQNDFADALVEKHLPLKAVPAPFIYFADAHLLPCIPDSLQSVKRRLPMVSQAVVTSISGSDAKRAEIQEGVAAMLQLHREGCIETLFVLDPHSPFAVPFGEETQLQFLSQAIASLLVARSHSHRNLSFPALLRELHNYSPLTAVSFANQVVALGPVPKRWSLLPGLSGRAGSGNYSDIITQAREAVDRVLTDRQTCAFPVPVGTNSPCHVILNVPLALNDPRFAACVSDMALYVETNYPFAHCTTVRANGCAYSRHEESRLRVQASCLYPIQGLSTHALQRVRNTKITTLFSGASAVEPTRESGLMNAGEIEPGATAKPAKKVRSRGTASSRKSTRKSTSAK